MTNLDYFADAWNVFIGIQLWHQCWQSQSQLNTLLAMELGRFNITLGSKTLLDGWRGIGKSENLQTDAEIAKYLVALWVMFSVTCKQWDLFSVYIQSTIWVYFGWLNFHQKKIWTLKKKKRKEKKRVDVFCGLFSSPQYAHFFRSTCVSLTTSHALVSVSVLHFMLSQH